MKERRELSGVTEEVLALERPMELSSAAPVNAGYRYGYAAAEDEETHLLDYWRAVRKHLWLVFGVALLGTTAGAIYMARKPDIYKAQARVQVDVENVAPSLGDSKAGSVILSNPTSDPAYFNTQLQILNSPGLLRRVVKTLDLERNPQFLSPKSTHAGSTWQNLRRMARLGGKGAEQQNAASIPQEVVLTTSVAPAGSNEDLVEAKRLAPYVAAIQRGLKVDPVLEKRSGSYNRETRLIEISFSHPDPQVGAKVVNAIADTFIRSNLEKQTLTSNTTGDFLQKRIAELQSQIRDGEERLINYAKSNQILSLDSKQDIVVDRLAGLNSQLLEAENLRKLAEAEYRAALAPGAASALAEGGAEKRDTEAKLAELRARRAQLLVENTEEWPEVKEINGQIVELEKQVQTARERSTSVIKTNLETRYRQALARENALRTAFNQQRGETLTQNEAAVNYRIIQQEIETNKTLLDGLLQRNKENEVVLAGRPNNIRIVDYALAPESPVAPNRTRGMLLALFLSLGLGIGSALLLEYLDNTIRTTEDVEKVLRLPAVAVIPSIVGATRRRLLPGAGALQRVSGNGHQAELLLDAEARSPLAEAYRQLRTSVLLSTAGHAPKTLLLTSSLPSEGKTTTATNLAISLAQTGASVLMIDADMRRPRLHSIFDLNNQRGLSSILSSEMNEAELLASVQQHETSGLHVLSSGPIPPNPAELLSSDQMRRLLTTLESTFTHIIVDSPPIASFTDGVLISTMVDGVLLVVHGGKSSRDVVKRSRQLLHDVGARTIGVVLNNVSLKHGDGYYYYQSYYGKYYSADAG